MASVDVLSIDGSKVKSIDKTKKSSVLSQTNMHYSKQLCFNVHH